MGCSQLVQSSTFVPTCGRTQMLKELLPGIISPAGEVSLKEESVVRKDFSPIVSPYPPTPGTVLRDVVERGTQGPILWPSAPGYRTILPPCLSHTALSSELPANGAKARMWLCAWSGISFFFSRDPGPRVHLVAQKKKIREPGVPSSYNTENLVGLDIGITE